MHVQTALYLCEFLQYSPYPQSIYPVYADSELISLLLFCKKKKNMDTLEKPSLWMPDEMYRNKYYGNVLCRINKLAF